MEESPVFYISKILENFGYPPAIARVYAILLYTGEGMTVTEISEVAGIGKSTASTALRLLEHDGLVYYIKHGKMKVYRAKSALNQLLLFPRRILNEYLVPLKNELKKEISSNKSPHLQGLLEELEKFEELTKEILLMIENRS